jgi:hypothetical protein
MNYSQASFGKLNFTRKILAIHAERRRMIAPLASR